MSILTSFSLTHWMSSHPLSLLLVMMNNPLTHRHWSSSLVSDHLEADFHKFSFAAKTQLNLFRHFLLSFSLIHFSFTFYENLFLSFCCKWFKWECNRLAKKGINLWMMRIPIMYIKLQDLNLTCYQFEHIAYDISFIVVYAFATKTGVVSWPKHWAKSSFYF